MYCLMCLEKMERSLFREDCICMKCRGKWIKSKKNVRIDSIRVDYSWIYNDAFSEALIQFKELGDEALKDVFLTPDRQRLKKKYHGYTLCLMPSTEKKISERGFSHLELMFGILGLPMIQPFRKKDEFVQKELSGSQRREMKDHIVLKEGIRLPRKLLLVDDVITTGSTIRGALQNIDLKQHKVRIYSCGVVL